MKCDTIFSYTLLIEIFKRTEMRANPKAHECSWLIPIYGILRSSKIHGVVGGIGQIDLM